MSNSHFDGSTYEPEQDFSRLHSALAKVYSLMRDGHCRTLAEIADACGCSESGASARLRDLRKPKFRAQFPNRAVMSIRLSGGVWVYRLMVCLLLMFCGGCESQEPQVGNELENAKRLSVSYSAEVEVRLWDGTRVDLLNDEHAIEVDWARKWAEAVGQSLYYAELTGRKPAIILLTRSREDDRYAYRCQTVCAKHGIRLFIEAAK